MSVHHTPEHGDIHHVPSLEIMLEREEHRLTLMAEPGRVLIPERLAEHVSSAEQIVARAESEGIAWPTLETAVPYPMDARSREFFLDDAEKSDKEFAYEALAGFTAGHGQRGFNNFPAIIGAKPYQPHMLSTVIKTMSMHSGLLHATYGSKPCLLRAYRVAPEFMASLQEAIVDTGGMTEWIEAMLQGSLEPEESPKEVALLRSSRLAYGLLMNLMREDDRQRQNDWLYGSRGDVVISDPETELWS